MSLPIGREPNGMYLEYLMQVVHAHAVVVPGRDGPYPQEQALRDNLKRWLDQMWVDAFHAGATWLASVEPRTIQITVDAESYHRWLLVGEEQVRDWLSQHPDGTWPQEGQKVSRNVQVPERQETPPAPPPATRPTPLLDFLAEHPDRHPFKPDRRV